MKPAVQNSTYEMEIFVTEEMTAKLDGREIHAVYSTFWLCYHAEVAARKAIEPYFETGENALGAEVCMRHEAMAAVGDTVFLTAAVNEVKGKKIVCTITARTAKKQIASGHQTQIVLPDDVLKNMVLEAKNSF
jgi:predicted thioesterase